MMKTIFDIFLAMRRKKFKQLIFHTKKNRNHKKKLKTKNIFLQKNGYLKMKRRKKLFFIHTHAKFISRLQFMLNFILNLLFFNQKISKYSITILKALIIFINLNSR